jgi:hypothetical protein
MALQPRTVISVGIGQIFHVVPCWSCERYSLMMLLQWWHYLLSLATPKEALAMEEAGQQCNEEELADAEETVQGSGTSKQPSTLGLGSRYHG